MVIHRVLYFPTKRLHKVVINKATYELPVIFVCVGERGGEWVEGRNESFIKCTKELHTLTNVNNCVNTNIYSYLDISGSQSFNLHLNVVYFFNTSVN